MASVSKTVLLPYSARQMYDLVEQVEAYPQFLPWCGGTTVHERAPDRMVASVRIDFKGLHQSFTTENRQSPPHSIEMRLRDGPFSRLDGEWHFTELREDACKVEFRLEYQFAGALLSRLLGPVFDPIAASFVDAFVKRAETVYR